MGVGAAATLVQEQGRQACHRLSCEAVRSYGTPITAGAPDTLGSLPPALPTASRPAASVVWIATWTPPLVQGVSVDSALGPGSPLTPCCKSEVKQV